MRNMLVRLRRSIPYIRSILYISVFYITTMAGCLSKDSSNNEDKTSNTQNKKENPVVKPPQNAHKPLPTAPMPPKELKQENKDKNETVEQGKDDSEDEDDEELNTYEYDEDDILYLQYIEGKNQNTIKKMCFKVYRKCKDTVVPHNKDFIYNKAKLKRLKSEVQQLEQRLKQINEQIRNKDPNLKSLLSEQAQVTKTIKDLQDKVKKRERIIDTIKKGIPVFNTKGDKAGAT